jgi:hypothetical protein
MLIRQKAADNDRPLHANTGSYIPVLQLTRHQPSMHKTIPRIVLIFRTARNSTGNGYSGITVRNDMPVKELTDCSL